MVKHKTEVLDKKTEVLDKKADLAGPGIGNYVELEKVLPSDYLPLLDPKETQRAITAVKRYIEDGLCRELGLMRVEVPLIVDAESGVNDGLDRDGSRGPVGFKITNDHGKNPVDAQVVQAATKWKRVALKQFGMKPGEGLVTDMRAVRKDYFLDHDHSAYVDQWDWEKVITADQRNLDTLTKTVEAIWRVIKGAEEFALGLFARGDEILDAGHFRLQRLGAGPVARLHRLAHLFGHGIAPGLGVLQLLHMFAPLAIERQHLSRHRRQPAPRQPPIERLRIVANGLDVMHGLIPLKLPIGR